jgi:hypothetical protein
MKKSVMMVMADVCNPMHQEQSRQKPCDTIQLAGEIRVQLE